MNAQESDVYKKRETLMGQGILTTPIVQKTYYYTQQPDLRAVKVSFKQQVAQWMDEEYNCGHSGGNASRIAERSGADRHRCRKRIFSDVLLHVAIEVAAVLHGVRG